MPASSRHPLTDQLLILGCATAVFIFKAAWLGWGSPGDDEDDLRTFARIIQVYCRRLGLVEPLQFFSIESFDTDRPMTTTIKICLEQDRHAKAIRESFGRTAALVYDHAKLLAMAEQAADMLLQAGKKLPPRKAVRDDLQSCRHISVLVAELAGDNFESLRTLFPARTNDIKHIASLRTAGTRQMSRMRSQQEALSNLINDILPEFHFIAERMEIARDLEKQLAACPTGTKSWKQYEELCLKILRFCFLPPFRHILEQSRIDGGFSRRDAVLPNTVNSSFWSAVRTEFDARHVICEFKNVSGSATKTNLDQLRIYLSRPTVGRFGFIMTRSRSNRQLRAAQRRAYEEHRILILILSDENIVDMLRTRAVLNTSDDVLEQLKIEFELCF